MLSYPRRGITRTDDPDMVRVQLKENDIRSYRRVDVDEILKATPGAFILGAQEHDDEDVEDEAPTQRGTSARSRRSAAPNKARQTKPTEPAETKVD